MPPEVVSDERFEDLPEDHPAVKALAAARQEARKARSEARLLKIQVKYPTMGFVTEDFEGVDPGQWERLADRLAEKVPSQAVEQPTATPPAAPPVEQEQQLTPEQAARLARFGPGALEGSAPQSAKVLNRDEAISLHKRNPTEYERLKAEGLINTGVRSVDKGGSIIFEPID